MAKFYLTCLKYSAILCNFMSSKIIEIWDFSKRGDSCLGTYKPVLSPCLPEEFGLKSNSLVKIYLFLEKTTSCNGIIP